MLRNISNKGDYKKFQVRGAIKEIMKNYGLRSISLSNYKKWTNNHNDTHGVHSVKYDIMNGYIHLHGYSEKGRCGKALENVDFEKYVDVYQEILDILEYMESIPNNIRRNILVKVSR